jgi:transposase
MGRRSNQSVLNSLLTRVEAGDNGFKYESKERKTIDWSKYDTAQINEINDMLESIRDSVDQAVWELNIEARYKEEKTKPGQPMVFPGDLAKALLLQQYFQVANRVAQGLVMLFKEKLRITDTFSYKSIERAYANRFVQDILHHLFIATQKPVIGKEHCFSTDGTGAPTSMKYNYETEKHRRKQNEERKLDTFEQLILTVGSQYQLITDFIMTSNPHANESPFLKEAVQRVSSSYEDIDVWTADAGYISRENTEAISLIGALPRIYPKKNDTFKAKGSSAWKQMHYDLIRDPQQWLRDYHQRSISETVNSVYVRMFPKPLGRDIRVRRFYEAFTRVCVYNLKRLVYLRYLEDIIADWDST